MPPFCFPYSPIPWCKTVLIPSFRTCKALLACWNLYLPVWRGRPPLDDQPLAAVSARIVPGKTHEYLAARRPPPAAIPATPVTCWPRRRRRASAVPPEEPPAGLLTRYELRRITEELGGLFDRVVSPCEQLPRIAANRLTR